VIVVGLDRAGASGAAVAAAARLRQVGIQRVDDAMAGCLDRLSHF
jgi:hypothetical protein